MSTKKTRKSTNNKKNIKKNIKKTNNKKPATMKKESVSVKETNPMRREIVFLVVIVIGILSVLSCFNMCGLFGQFLGSLLFGLFGLLAYVFPIYLIGAVGFYISNPSRREIRRKVIFSIFVFWCLCALFQWVVNDPVDNLWQIYNVCVENRGGGGLLGGLLSFPLTQLFGRGGSLIVLLALFILFFMLITGKLFFSSLYQMYRDNDKYEDYVKYEEESYDYDDAYLDSYDYNRNSAASAKQPAMVTLEQEEQIQKPVKKKQTPKIKDTSEKIEKEREPDTQTADADIFSGIKIIGADDPKPIDEVSRTPIFKEEMDEKFGSENSDFNMDKSKEKEAGLTEEERPVKKQKVVITKEDEKEMEKVQEDLAKAAVTEIPYEYPPLDLLSRPKAKKSGMSQNDLKNTALKLQETLDSFGVRVKMGDISLGPSVTRYELIPEQGVKVSRITGLSDDIKLSLAASDIRIEAPIPGKSAVGIEVPNANRSMVTLRELLESSEFQSAKSKVTFAVGKDIGGKTIVTDIAKMPHLLIAGATGSGKSVLINTLIMSILYKANPNEVKLIMVDPKMVELTAYENIPHLMIPVVNDPKKASAALAWAVAEMTNRYQRFADAGVRDIASYNARIEKTTNKDDPEFQKMPQIVIIVDEFADLMMVAPGEVEDAVCRLAQLARAAGIHLVLATQRPSVNVITGLIKANIPSRIALSVSSQVDSRTIIDTAGADKLLGNGDMLFAPQNLPKPIRVQGAFVSDEERDGVVGFLKSHSNGPSYNEEVTKHIDTAPVAGASGGATGTVDAPDQDELFVQAGMFIIEKDKASIGLLQRMFRIGFNRAARIMDQLSDAGVVGPEEGTKARQILMSKEQFENYLEENG